ncbi:hypothetical protein CCHR01_03381 [Colletotrichum chrysophilum]|uniref:Uncharacterized protein n=1 Tax=Colletotrichum chrysophilum TaxID=1836956 RepID=A0AAD9ATX8_9PEZI|nr:hypothetical protein CCHR01_03381 [Colletotrichum chrysophilum]
MGYGQASPGTYAFLRRLGGNPYWSRSFINLQQLQQQQKQHPPSVPELGPGTSSHRFPPNLIRTSAAPPTERPSLQHADAPIHTRGRQSCRPLPKLNPVEAAALRCSLPIGPSFPPHHHTHLSDTDTD